MRSSYRCCDCYCIQKVDEDGPDCYPQCEKCHEEENNEPTDRDLSASIKFDGIGTLYGSTKAVEWLGGFISDLEDELAELKSQAHAEESRQECRSLGLIP